MQSSSSHRNPYKFWSNVRLATVRVGLVPLFRIPVLMIFITKMGWLAYGQAADPSVAIVNGRSISQSEVEKVVIAQTLPLEEKLYAIRKAALENLITGRVLEEEAGKRGISIAELRKQLASGDVHVTQGEVEAAYAENASFFASMSPDEARERLRLDLENQVRMRNYRTALEKLRKEAHVDLLIKDPRVPELSDLSPGQSVGPGDAAVTIVEFSDFECPYCRAAQAAIKQVLATYSRTVRLIFKHLPLQIHQHALVAAKAGFCAGEQNRFWQFHDALFSSDSINSDSLKTIALKARLDQDQLDKCLSSDRAATAISLNVQEAKQLGIVSTPTFIINGKLIRGAMNFEEFKLIIERELTTSSQQPQPARKD